MYLDSNDSRKVTRIIYLLQQKEVVDAHIFIEAAISNGASLRCEDIPKKQANTTYIQVEDSNRSIGFGRYFLDHPSSKLKLIEYWHKW